MSLKIAENRLQDETKSFLLVWNSSRDRWDDEVRRRFDEEYIHPIERHLRSAQGAMERMQEIIVRARHECSDSGSLL